MYQLRADVQLLDDLETFSKVAGSGVHLLFPTSVEGYQHRSADLLKLHQCPET